MKRMGNSDKWESGMGSSLGAGQGQLLLGSCQWPTAVLRKLLEPDDDVDSFRLRVKCGWGVREEQFIFRWHCSTAIWV